MQKQTSTFMWPLFRNDPDYVTRRFNASSGGLSLLVGLDLRWDTALRDLQIQLEPRVSRSEAALLGMRLVRMVPGSARDRSSYNPI
jgi:hypothetical protein